MAVSNSLQTRVSSGKLTVSQFLTGEKVKASLNKMLGTEKETQKFVSSILSATSTNLALQECDNSTILSAALLANALNLSLSPQLGLAYLVPFDDKKNNRTVATFVLGYKGYIQLAIRSGNYKKNQRNRDKRGRVRKIRSAHGRIIRPYYCGRRGARGKAYNRLLCNV